VDKLVGRVLAAADGGEQALINQVFQTGTRRSWIPVTRSAPFTGRARELIPVGEDFKNAPLVLLETCAAVRADKLLFNEDSHGVRPPGKTSLVKPGDDGLDVGFALAKGDLRNGCFGSSAWRCKSALIELTAEK
jgi:hypothetical protein